MNPTIQLHTAYELIEHLLNLKKKNFGNGAATKPPKVSDKIDG